MWKGFSSAVGDGTFDSVVNRRHFDFGFPDTRAEISVVLLFYCTIYTYPNLTAGLSSSSSSDTSDSSVAGFLPVFVLGIDVFFLGGFFSSSVEGIGSKVIVSF